MPSGMSGDCTHEGDEPGPLPALAATPPGRPSRRSSPSPAHEPGEQAQQRRLAGAVGPDDGDPLARRRRAGRRRRARAGRRARPGRRRGSITRCRRVRSTRTKNGAPKNAVTTPMGISAGEATVRARRSASTRNAPPNSSDSGRMIAVAAAGEQPHGVRDDDADEGDEARHRHRGGGAERAPRRRRSAGVRRACEAERRRPRRRRRRARRASRRCSSSTTADTATYGSTRRDLAPARRSTAGRGSSCRPARMVSWLRCCT